MSLFTTRKKYYAVFLARQEGSYTLLKRKRVSPNVKKVKYRSGATKVISIENPTFVKGLRVFYFIDINGAQLNFDKDSSEIISANLVDLVLETSAIKQLTANLSQKLLGGQLLTVIMAFLIGAFLGYIIAGFF